MKIVEIDYNGYEITLYTNTNKIIPINCKLIKEVLTDYITNDFINTETEIKQELHNEIQYCIDDITINKKNYAELYNYIWNLIYKDLYKRS